jgi:hypothetical protein
MRSVTREILEQLSNRDGPVRAWPGQELLEAPDEIRRQIVQRFEECSNEFLCGRTVHDIPRPENKWRMSLQRTKNPRSASTADEEVVVGFR